MSEVAAEDTDKEVDELKDYTAKEVLKEASANIKMELKFHMSPVSLKIQSGPHSQTMKEQGSLRTRYAKVTGEYKEAHHQLCQC